MIRLVCCLCQVLALYGSAAAAGDTGESRLLFQGRPHDSLYAVSFEGRDGIAVGDYGLIVRSADGGRTWKPQPAPTDLALLAVARRAGRCIAGGQEGLLMVADDCSDWKVLRPATGGRILAVEVNEHGLAFAVGGFGTLLRSEDWGQSWQPLAVDWSTMTPGGAEPHLYGVHVAANDVVTIVGEFEVVMRSVDGGASWTVLHAGRRSLFDLEVIENGTLYAVGQEGLILRGVDNGRSWQELPSGTSSILTGVGASPDGQLVVTGMYSILSSSDGGDSWQVEDSRLPSHGWHQAVAAGAGDDGRPRLVAVGSGGAILLVQR